MKSPVTGKEMKLIRKTITLPFRKDVFEVIYHHYLCEDSGEQFTDDELDHINQTQVHNQYREKYGIPFPEEIARIRSKYKVSASKMSEILGFGPNTYRLYEAGDIPSVANGRLILSVDQPEEFLRQVKASAHLLTGKETIKFTRTAQEAEEKEDNNIWNTSFEESVFQFNSPNEYSGFRILDLNKVSGIIAFFGKHADLYKTKLNKLLFYADFLMYQKNGYSITGITYRAIPYGPVPAEYDKLYIKLRDKELIEIEEKLFDNGHYGEVINPRQPFDAAGLNETELSVLDRVIKKFRHLTTKEVVDISHGEPAWIENKDGKKTISYQKYAYDLKAV